MRDEPVRFWNMNQRLLREKNWSSLNYCYEQLVGRSEIVNGKNPFAVIDFRHGDEFWELEMGIKNGNVHRKHVINKGNLVSFRCRCGILVYWKRPLSKPATKIKMLDARNKDKQAVSFVRWAE